MNDVFYYMEFNDSVATMLPGANGTNLYEHSMQGDNDPYAFKHNVMKLRKSLACLAHIICFT